MLPSRPHARSTGIFTGTMIGNGCPTAWSISVTPPTNNVGKHDHSAPPRTLRRALTSPWHARCLLPGTTSQQTCFSQTFPAFSGLNGLPVGYVPACAGRSLTGMCISGPNEAGFSYTAGGMSNICTNSSYFCAGGADLSTCLAEIEYTCGTTWASSTLASSNSFGDTCGGHAAPCALPLPTRQTTSTRTSPASMRPMRRETRW